MEKYFGYDLLQVCNLERKQFAIPPARVGIYAHDWLAVQILNRVRHQTVLTERDHCVFRTKYEVWKKATVNDLHPAEPTQDGLGFHQSMMICFVLPQVVLEVDTLMLDVEPGLA